ncbi:dTMP kinase [Niastella caeni]|uniref:Thymidylate kinase n=1 Tax=Niastella caeni TaxID=2569763 RepID=A0A4S8I1G4_9BACT|nr:dTMP kinase [Niastella caeni]THU41983.1 dTMP kinase [Niastella caeni]
MKKRNNLFIALEGIDGSGKSTQTKLLTEQLTSQGHKVYSTFEPTDNPIGKLIRNILKGNTKADHRIIAGLFVADRLDHLLNEENGIVKKLEEGFTVITDRYCFSSYAYQGTHMSMDWVIQANSMSADILRPDINIFIDVAPETSIQRLHANRDNIELFETLDNLKLVRAKYMEAFEKLKAVEHIVIVDGNRSPDLIAKDIWQQVQSMMVQ